MTTTLSVTDMTCDHCKATVEKALLDLDGVQRATADLEAKTVDVDHAGSVRHEDLAAAVSTAGYSVAGIER